MTPEDWGYRCHQCDRRMPNDVPPGEICSPCLLENALQDTALILSFLVKTMVHGNIHARRHQIGLMGGCLNVAAAAITAEESDSSTSSESPSSQEDTQSQGPQDPTATTT